MEGRFAALLAAGEADRAAHDAPLLSTKDWIVAPTLGAIVPNWLIVLPKVPALSFRDWARPKKRNPADIIAEIAAHLDLSADQIIWFEHGPEMVGTHVGCGVDYAHLHMILSPRFSFETLISVVQKAVDLDWQVTTSRDAYTCLAPFGSYLVLSSGDLAVTAEGVEQTGSQFMRRMVAEATGTPENWNYKSHPHHENVATTIKTFRALERSKRHAR